MLRRIDRKQDILKTLNLEDTSLEFRAFAIERSRGAFFGFASVPHWITPFRDRIRPDGIQPLRIQAVRAETCILRKFITLFTVVTLAAAVLWRSSPDYRVAVEIVVSVGAIVLAVSALSAHKIVWGLVFLGLLGVFTPFRSSQFSSALVATFDMLTLALFAASPIMFRKSAIGFRKSFRKSPTGFREPGTP
jgi:hypothetical protein